MLINQFGQMWGDDRFGPMHQRVVEHSPLTMVMCLFWIFISIAAIILVYRLISHHDHSTSHRDPLDIAKERFAKGEISKTELAEIKKELKS